MTSGPKSSFISDNILTKAILFFFICLEVNSTLLITSELDNQRMRKVLFTCVVYTKYGLLTKFEVKMVDIGQVLFFCMFMDQDEVEVHKLTKKRDHIQPS